MMNIFFFLLKEYVIVYFLDHIVVKLSSTHLWMQKV